MAVIYEFVVRVEHRDAHVAEDRIAALHGACLSEAKSLPVFTGTQVITPHRRLRVRKKKDLRREQLINPKTKASGKGNVI